MPGKRIGILTDGGDVPGLNSVIKNVVYRSTYPDTSMTEHVDRASPTRYTIHFSQTTNGKTLQSMDVCTRS